MKPDASFETERLLLKPTTSDDAEFIYELLNSPKWLKYIGDRNINKIEDAIAYIEKRIRPQQIKLGYSNYTVIRKKDGAKIGSCGLYDRQELEGIDLGFAFLPSFEKQGYGFESANRLLDAGINTHNLKQISAITTRDNIDSQRLLQKIGLKHIENIVLPGDIEEIMLYRINSEDHKKETA